MDNVNSNKQIDRDSYTVDCVYHYFFAILVFCFAYCIASRGHGDFGPHLRWAPTFEQLFHPFQYLQKNGEPLWHQITRLINVIFRIPMAHSGGIVCGLSNVAVYEIIRLELKQYTTKYNFVAFLCMVMGPMWLPWYNNGKIYLGQGSPNVWHNPTMYMVKPFAFLVVINTVKLLDEPITWGDFKTKWKKALFISILILLSALAKPCFYQVFFPAIFVYCIILIIKNGGQFFCNAFLLFLSCIPTVILFVFQFARYFGARQLGAGGNGVSVKFLYVIKMHTAHPYFSLFLCIVFPILMLVYILTSKSKTSSVYKISWLCYFFGLLEWLFLVENKRPSHRNFGWGYELSVSMVFVASVIEYLKCFYSIRATENKLKKIAFSIITVLLELHIIVGIIYVARGLKIISGTLE